MKNFPLFSLCIFVLAGIFAGLLLVSCASTQQAPPVAKTTYGLVSGEIIDGIYSFKGIPYAKADRFMPPQPPAAWDGVREHTKFGPIAMQVNSWSPDTAMDEKALFTVNIWTQGLNDGKKRPVMFWLHGGGFSVGASDDPITDGKMLAQNGDVVLVSVNHRVNILGFLDLSDFGEEYNSSANVGMLDVVAALEWVNKNIQNFGGDPQNVTIFGESGGGGKVGTLMSMPAANGLFHKAIIQSGTLINVMTKDKSRAVGRALVEHLGLTRDSLHQLHSMPYKELVLAGNKALEATVGLRQPGTRTMFGFGPVPDGENLMQQPFTPGFAAISNHIPLLLGTTLNELVPTAYGETSLTMDAAKDRLQKIYGEKADHYIELFGQAYPDYSPHDLLSIDTLFRPNTIAVADAREQQARAPIYTYLLTWKSPVENGSKGSFHGLDIPLAFNNIELGKHWSGDSEESRALAEKMSSAWIQFARTGNPNTESLPQWKPYSRENGETMLFDDSPTVVHHHDRALMNFIQSNN